MIIETPNGAVLEVFWRQRGTRPWSQVTARRFLSNYRRDRRGLQGIRWLFSDRTATGPTWRNSDPAILQRAAWLVETDSVIVAEFDGTERWPGSGHVLGSGMNSSLLFWRDQLHLIRDLAQVEQWLASLRDGIKRVEDPAKKNQSPSKADLESLNENKQYFAALRELVSSAPGVPDYSMVSDYEFLNLVSGYFKSGDLLPIYHRYPGISDPGPDDPIVPPPPPPPKPKPDDDPDDPIPPFIPGVCLLRASHGGSPFVTIPDSSESGEPK